MRIRLAVRGGLAAGLGRTERELDSSTLPTGEAASLVSVVAAAIAESVDVPELPPLASPKALRYTVTIEDQGALTTLHSCDADMPPRFSGLIDELERLLP